MMEGGRREIELFLAFGASGWESMARLINESVGAGATPRINSLNVIGLVTIPGGFSKWSITDYFVSTVSQCFAISRH